MRAFLSHSVLYPVASSQRAFHFLFYYHLSFLHALLFLYLFLPDMNHLNNDMLFLLGEKMHHLSSPLLYR